MIACKFLSTGALGPLTAHPWPMPVGGAPGPWVEARAFPSRGVHAFEPSDAAYWLADELWIVELGGACQRAPTIVVAERGRLVRRIDDWNVETEVRFLDDVVERARRSLVATADPETARLCFDDLGECARDRAVATAAFVATALAAIVSGKEDSARAEREMQSAWLRRALDLDSLCSQPPLQPP